MNVILIYILSIIAIILFPMIGYFLYIIFLNKSNSSKFTANSFCVSGNELIENLAKKHKLSNLKTVKLDAKKTNYFYPKYNVIKLSPETYYASDTKSLANCIFYENQARLCQQKTLLYLLKTALNFTANLLSAIFIPAILILSIINTTNPSATIQLIMLIFLICYAVSFVLQIIMLLCDIISLKKYKPELKNLNIFSEDEIIELAKNLNQICFYNFYKNTRKVYVFLALTNPDNILRINSN